MLMCKYHVLARYKAEQQCPGADNMVGAFFQNSACSFSNTLQK